MKRFSYLLLIPVALLSGCNNKNSEPPTYKEPFYNEVEEYHIDWNDIFLKEHDKYYVYIYSIACPQCSALREGITELAKKEYEYLYFVYPSDDIVFVEDASTADNSIGATSIEDLSIYTTPTLIEIENKVVTSYTRDYYTIRDFIESYSNEK